MAYYDQGEESYVAGIGTNLLPQNNGVMPYFAKRREEYPDIREQLDDLFKAGAFSTAMTARIQATKDRYPKETDAEFQAKLDEHRKNHP
tara:strand:- start:669 stop:935 length:267 start_codon:yes stop_codon:yes gene_type:complete